MPISEADIFLKLNAIDALRQTYGRNGLHTSITEAEELWSKAVRAMDEVWKMISSHPVLGQKLIELIAEAARESYMASPNLHRFGESRGTALMKEDFTWHYGHGISIIAAEAVNQIYADFDEIGRLLPYLLKAVKQD